MKYVTVDQVKLLHTQVLRRYGGAQGIRDEGLLASAVARAEQKAFYDTTADTSALAAALAWGLIRNHAFVDGNKRVGLAALTTFLDLNGFTLDASESEQIDTVQRAAARDLDEQGFTDWVKSSVTKQ